MTLMNGGDWHDYDHLKVTAEVRSAKLFDPATPDGMVFVPGGIFRMGDCAGDHAADVFGELNEDPVHTVQLDAFYISAREITQGEWERGRNWALGHGYAIGCAGNGKGPDYPAGCICWHDAVLWCNAKSEMEGLTPCYYTDAAQTTVYRSGTLDLSSNAVDWSASGYRLPCEAEWEYAARGGLRDARFAFGATIAHTQANYFSTTNQAYDVSATRGGHPDYDAGAPCTCPCGALPGQGYGLFEIAGNVREWCWDHSDGARQPCDTCSGAGQVACPDCGGIGHTDCATCSGTGRVTCDECSGTGSIESPCSACGGSGLDICPPCSGGGFEELGCAACSGLGFYTCTGCGGSGNEPCGACGGNGSVVCPYCGGNDPDCPGCGGVGQVTCSSCGGSGQQTCSTCGGSGEETCGACGGAGTVNELCSTCSGAGSVACANCGGTGLINSTCEACSGAGNLACPSCGGSGSVVCGRCGGGGHEDCSICSGRGQLWHSDYYAQSAAANPRGPLMGDKRIVRGGAWDSDADTCRVAHRREVAPTDVNAAIGFRPIRAARP